MNDEKTKDFGNNQILEVKAVLEKFDGEGEDAVLAERITIVNDEIVRHEFFEDGELITVNEGGTNATN